MKKLLFFLILVIFTAGTAYAALPTILVDSISPSPVEPGQDLTIDITLYNRLSSDTGDFSVFLDYPFPFILKSSSENLETVNLCGGCGKKNTYFLTVDPTAISGNYVMYVKASQGSTESRYRIDISVKGKPNIIISTASPNIENVVPGSSFSVDLDVTNIGSGPARQIKIQADSSQFVVIGSSTKTIDILNSFAIKQATFDFVAGSSLDSDSYAIPFKISYLDSEGRTINSSQSIGVKVIDEGNINIQSIKIASSTGGSVITAGGSFTVVVRLENIGKGDADSVVAEMTCPFNGAKKAFIGQLKRDEDAPAVFDLVSGQSGTFNCNLKINYEDDTGEHEFTEQFEVSITPQDYSGLVIFIIIITIIVYIFRKRIFSRFGKKK